MPASNEQFYESGGYTPADSFVQTCKCIARSNICEPLFHKAAITMNTQTLST